MEEDQVLGRQLPGNDLVAAVPTAAQTKFDGRIFYDRSKSEEYGRYCSPSVKAVKRDGSGISYYHENQIYLGRVINKDDGIFFTRKRGVYKFTAENGFEEVNHPEDYIVDNRHVHEINLRFGASWVYDEYLKLTGMDKVLQSLSLGPSELDTLNSLIAFKTFAKDKPYSYADNWYAGDYACILYPKAILYSQSISVFLKKFGSGIFYHEFFSSYLDLFNNSLDKNESEKVKITYDENLHPLLIDSTGLINHINIPATAKCSHGGQATQQIRLIYVIDHSYDTKIWLAS
jgi:hypothetical protein